MNISAPRGTKDLFGDEIKKNNEIVEILTEIVAKYGYSEIKTPTFEDIKLFNSNFDKTFLPNKELFFLEGKEYVLRPENTAAIVRATVQHKLLNKIPSPVQFFYFGPFFRYERPQAGRFREFSQFGVEKINATSIYDDLEIIFLVNEIIKKFNLPFTFCINYLGSIESKLLWSQELRNYFREYASQLSSASLNRINKNPIRILDDKNDREKDFVKKAPTISRYFSQSEQEDIEFLKNFLIDAKIDFVWDKNLVRGIDYYTGFVYEWKYKNLTVIGGGRYNSFFDKFSHKSVSCLGFAIGIERLKNCLETIEYSWKYKNQEYVYFANLTDSLESKVFDFLSALRAHGIFLKTNWSKNKLKDHFKNSEKFNSKILLIFGEKEQNQEKIILKCRSKKFEKVFSLNEVEKIASEIKSWMK